MNAEISSLDQLSTSPTKKRISFLEELAFPALCIYHAPYFAYQKEGKFYGVTQGNCHHWDCPKCGLGRAKHEYGRIVEGILLLSKINAIYFITLTCRGKEISVSEAETHYLEWTNRFLDAARIKAKREGQDWYYVQVTERQKRGHPHSHILTTFNPGDLELGWKANWKYRDRGLVNEWVACYRSEWVANQSIKSGLGSEYDVSVVREGKAASRYVAKYLFKSSMFSTTWRKGWKRVRYSQNFPKLPKRESVAFVLLSTRDWQALAGLASVVITDSAQTKAEVLYRLSGHDVLVG